MKRRALGHPPASDRLLKALPAIAYELESGRARRESALVPKPDRAVLRELGLILFAIRRGESASRLFRQNERTKPKQENYGAIAIVYWYWFACTGKADAALKKVQAATRLRAPASAATIKKIAQRFRDSTLDLLKQAEKLNDDGFSLQLLIYELTRPISADARVIPEEVAHDAAIDAMLGQARSVQRLSKENLAALREYLRKKSPRTKL
ncbi:MAG TPA: hypothetical protein VIH50_00930 [Steroidobacteraceae bacterium]